MEFQTLETALLSSPVLLDSSWLNVLSPAAVSTRSSPFLSPRFSPPPGCLVSQSLHLSPLHASSWGRNHLTPRERKQKCEMCFRWMLRLMIVKRQLTPLQTAHWFTCMIRLSWLFCCNKRVFSCSKVKMYSAVCCRMAAWRTTLQFGYESKFRPFQLQLTHHLI